MRVIGSLIKNLGSPTFMRRANAFLTVFWIIMVPISIWTGWVYSVAYVSALSLWALVASHWSAWEAARVEVAQERAEKKALEEDIPQEVTDRLVEQTEIHKTEDKHDIAQDVTDRILEQTEINPDLSARKNQDNDTSESST